VHCIVFFCPAAESGQRRRIIHIRLPLKLCGATNDAIRISDRDTTLLCGV
jgi:hypothetical protein